MFSPCRSDEADGGTWSVLRLRLPGYDSGGAAAISHTMGWCSCPAFETAGDYAAAISHTMGWCSCPAFETASGDYARPAARLDYRL